MKNNAINPIIVCVCFVLFGIMASCGKPSKNTKAGIMSFEKGTFGHDLQFLKKKDNVIVLKAGDAQLIVSPKYQGKVFTSTAMGLSGKSFGWINYDALNSDTIVPHINAYGGEDRLWLGPEGGQFSIFFKNGDDMILDNWQTPAGIDSEPWDLDSQDKTSVTMKKELELENYSGTRLSATLNRVVNLLNEEDLNESLGLSVDTELKWVGFESINTLTNSGSEKWTKEKGTLCVWILGMFNPFENGAVVIPYEKGDEKELGSIATTNYFGEIPDDRIKMENGLLFFKVDGKLRSKLGLSHKRSTSIAASYDAEGSVLTIVQFNLPENDAEYVNQLWEIQEEPFTGDVINSYNDGPVADGSQLGPFYEIETSSPAAFLGPDESLTHTQQIYHFVGSEKQLNVISEQILGVSIEKISSRF